ncbi:MAG: DNA-binding FrmR family transcriptional regulator [Granulosicoccus sp.]|jgi:DNA-binding FrmR family transcriptional regulator
MEELHTHQSHPALVKRLKRADGHLRHVIEMIESGRPCTEIAQQLQAVERAVINAKRVLIHDHIDHCLQADNDSDLDDMKLLAKLL